MTTRKKAKATKAKQVERVLHKCPFCDACPHVKEAEGKQRVVHVPVYVDPQEPTTGQPPPHWPPQPIYQWPTITCGG